MKKVLIIILIIILGTLGYARYIEPNKLITKEYTIESKLLPQSFDGFKIVQFSDLYYKGNKSMVTKLVKEINKSNADIVFFTGDLTYTKPDEETAKYLISELSKIKATEYKYAILGDHDDTLTKDILEESGFIILNNSAEYLFNESEEPITIAGGDKLTQEILEKDVSIESNFSICLIHKPDLYENIKNLNPTLVLAGHSLGGEINLPLWGNLIKKNGAKIYNNEVYKNLYISYGIGTSKLGMRLFNKPSINLYRLNAK